MRIIYLNDGGITYDEGLRRFAQADQWAQEHCESYQGYGITDVSDFSGEYDSIASYQFGHDQDAIIFRLRWR